MGESQKVGRVSRKNSTEKPNSKIETISNKPQIVIHEVGSNHQVK